MVADLFHYGHVNFLRQARKYGDYLMVGVHADETVMSYKRRPILSRDERSLKARSQASQPAYVPTHPTFCVPDKSSFAYHASLAVPCFRILAFGLVKTITV